MSKRKLVLALAGLLIGSLVLAGVAQADGLPPRPPVPETSAAVGGYIELQLPTNQILLWTAVQWQDSLGGWHTVQGWQGTLDSLSAGVGNKRWWVAPADFGKGPFRWQVYQLFGGQLLATSDSFNLPSGSNKIVVVEASLNP
jgi:hypothetical protein